MLILSNFFFCAVPLPPTNFSIVEEYPDVNETTVLLAWEAPQGSGTEFMVDTYSITISPEPPYQSVVMLESPPWNVTLLHNQEYTANISSVNCVGESVIEVLSIDEFGKISKAP